MDVSGAWTPGINLKSYSKRALKIKESAYGADDERVAQALDDYAHFLRKENRGTEASVLEQRAKVIRSKANQ